ncbi:glycoside hydrolase family 66 protein [Leifsonia bigeumensis]|uniref:Glycoside hydrolase family 66 protein n=1 Tax=Leifsonella bigeumensis TaxID=433643 RepID=A0ABP7F738_9MICO
MALIPDRATYAPGHPVVIELSAPAPADGMAVVSRLNEIVRTVPVAALATMADLGSFDRGGYGVRIGSAVTAFDVLDDPFERPRYGFVVEITEGVDVPEVSRFFRRLHLNLAQFYDWAYRHSQLMPPGQHYVDPLGQERDLGTVDRMAGALADAGTVPLGYSAVYAIGSDEVADWGESLLLRSDGEPYRLGEDFLVLVDPAEPRWLEHYLAQLEQVLEGTALRGFHLDQYGWPKFATRGDGARVDLSASFVALLGAVRDRMPGARFMFNNVNDFPTLATAPTPQDATYIEVWAPHTELQDLATLATDARAARPEHPPILSAYLSCYREDGAQSDEASANRAAGLVMATAFSHGASHLLLGEDGHALTDPYYPRNHELAEGSIDFFAAWYDFAVRYGDLLFDPAAQDVTGSFTGGINEDVVLTGADFSTKADAGAVWTHVVRTPLGLVIHLINLVGQTETAWDAGKNPTQALAGASLELALVREGTEVWFASVDEPDMVALPRTGTSASAQTDALSAGQSSTVFSLPALQAYSIVFIPEDGLG